MADPAATVAPGRHETDPRWFRPALALVVVGALALRVVYVLVSRRNFVPGGDAYFYHAGANLLADGKGFISPFAAKAGVHRAAAEHPPLYLVFLAVPSVIGLRSVLTHLLWSALLGSSTVGLVGLLGRAVGGARVGIGAAVIAALYPNLWAPDGMLEAETLSMFAVVVVLLLAYRYRQAPSGLRLALVGAACGAGALARSELILFVPFLLVPLAWTTRDRAGRERLRELAIAVAAAAIVIAPWTIYNTARFVHPILLSAQIDPLLASANCDSTYYGEFRGYFDIQCAIAIAKREHITAADDESQEDLVYRRAAFAYIRANPGRLPFVEGVRLLRIAGLYKTSLYVHADTYIEGRDPAWISWAALDTFWGLALLSIAGAVVRRRARTRAPDRSWPPLWPLLAPVAVVVVTVLVTYASTRFRTTAEPVIAVLAAVAIDAGIVWARGRYTGRRRSAPRTS